MTIQADLSQEKLNELLNLKHEMEQLDYKVHFDYSSRGKQARVRLLKDILAMANTPGGGYIVLGVRDKDFEPIGLPLDYALDQATLQDKVLGYSNRQIGIHYAQYKMKRAISDDPKPKVRMYGMIYVEPSEEPIIAAKDGNAVLDDGKQETVFACGDILVRRGTKSERANDRDITRMFEAYREIDKGRNWQQWNTQLSMLVQELIQQNMLVSSARTELEKESKEWQNLPRPDFEDFIGRETYLAEIMESLLQSRAWIVSIDGVGGVGKTALALQSSYQCWEQRCFELVIWASAKSSRLTLSGIDQIVPSLTSLENILDEIIKIVFPDMLKASKDEKLAEVKYILRNLKCLLVVDNLETVTDQAVMQFLRDIPEPSKALVTSRHRVGQGERVIRLEGFDTKEAVKFIQSEAKRSGAAKLLETSTYNQKKIIQATGGVPLAIKWVVGQIALGRTVSEAVKRLMKEGSAPLEFCFRETYQLLSDEAKTILKCVPLFNNPALALEFAAATDLPLSKIEDGLAELVRVSMLNIDSPSSDILRYSALPMTRYFSQSLTNRGEQSNMLKRLSVHYQRTEALGKLKEQAADLFQMAGASTEKGQTAAMLSQVAFANYQRGRYDEATKLFEQAVSISPRLSFIYQTWATVEWQEGNYTRARELWQEAARLNPNNSLIWRSWGLMEKELRNSNKAKECFKKAVSVNENDKVAWNALGTEHRKDSEYREAERCLLRALYSEPKTESERHHNVVTYHPLAVTLKNMGRAKEARHYCELGLKLEAGNTRLLQLQKDLRD